MVADLANIPRIYTALAEWLACLVFIMIVKNRFPIHKTALISLIFLAVQSVFLVVTEETLGVMWLLYMVLAVLLMFMFIYSTCSITLAAAGYYTIHAFVLAEFAASLEWQIHSYLWPNKITPDLATVLLLIGVYAAINVGSWLVITRYTQRSSVLNVEPSHLFSAYVIGISVFAISNLSYLTTKTPFSGQFAREIFNIRTITGLCGLLLLGAYNLSRTELNIRRELDTVKRVLRSQYKQYQLSKDALEHINSRYHDLKHQISFLRAEEDSKRRNEFLDTMEKGIKTYETQYKTGNPVLDTILSGKALYCTSNDISLTCVANGALLEFMDVVDICTVIGNALDNAIEHVVEIADTEKRLIHIAIFSSRNFLVIRFENYMQGQLNLNGRSLPATTKKDSEYHGYGLKSVKYVAEKYGGTLSVEEENSWFYLKIIIPLDSNLELETA